jgi:septal ring factor EnvC (AmiA/AmiB activator)
VIPAAARCGIALAMALAGSGTHATEDPADAELGRRESELAALRLRIDAITLEERATRDEHDTLLQDLERVEERIGELARQLRTHAQRAEAQQQRLAALEVQRTRGADRLATERAVLARQLRGAYLHGREGRLQLWLKQQDPAEAGRAATYFDYFYRARAAQVAAVRDAATALDATVAALQAETAALAAAQAQAATERNELEALRDARRTAAAALAARLKGHGQTLEGLRRDEAQLQRLLESLREALVGIPADPPESPPFTARRGQLPWPAAGELTARFGEPRTAGPAWDGVFITAGAGTEVHAIHRGRVAFAEWLRGFGLLLILDHGDGYMSLYGHNESLLKELGEWVEAGEAVGVVGSSGGREDTGVYFAIRHRGRALDPAAWCRKEQRNRVG